MKSLFLSLTLILGTKYDYLDMVKWSILHTSMASYVSLVSLKILKIICADEKNTQLSIIDSRCLSNALFGARIINYQ